MLPTFLALAGASLPTNKSFDGADLSPVLFDGKPNHAEALFHPSEFTGVLSAVRFHQYKFFWTTYGVDDCNQTSPVPPSIDHAVPLVFDLSADPTESTPLTNVDPRLYARAEELRAAKLADIYSTPRTNANFAEGTTADWPCCDPQHVVCRCTD
jgi:arylsulfatase G